MGKYTKWIAGGLGWAFLGPIGGIMGYLLGSALDKANVGTTTRSGATTQGDFIVCLLILIAAVMKADKKVVRSELDYVKSYFVKSFGSGKASEAILMLRDILEQPIPVNEICKQIQKNLDYPSRLQLLHFLFGIAGADGRVIQSELNMIKQIAFAMGIQAADYSSIMSMFYQNTESFYKILEISSDANDEEVKKAYRRMAVKYHPDKVSYLGKDIQKAAKEKFQKVNEAYEKIKQERGIA